MLLSGRDNPRIKELQKLLSDAKARRKSGRFVIEGARLCEDAVRSGVRVLSAFATEEATVRYADSWQAVEAAADTSFLLSSERMRALSDTGSPQGILCLCEQRLCEVRFTKGGVYAALEDLQDPGNLGTVLRTAEALGAKGVLLSKGCCDLFNPKVLRASMGGVFRVPCRVCEDFCAELATLAAERPVLAAVVDAHATPITEAPKEGAVIVIGNEGNGLTADAIAACNHRVTIPMAGRAESLNASMAAGILLWELCREGGRIDG